MCATHDMMYETCWILGETHGNFVKYRYMMWKQKNSGKVKTDSINHMKIKQRHTSCTAGKDIVMTVHGDWTPKRPAEA